jgi:cellulose synthase/poly-beta-1,6-N-acetylglucosamine synthase-like glycosyltransferase
MVFSIQGDPALAGAVMSNVDYKIQKTTQPVGRQLKVLIGIPAHNEQENIGKTVEFLANRYPSHGILVVSSGSTDMTDTIVRQLMSQYPNVELVVEPQRRGKSLALSRLLRRLNEGYCVMIYMGADNIPDEGAINKLLQRLNSDAKLGLIGGRPVPLNDPNTLAGWMTHLLWGVHHEISVQEPKVSGELCAIRAGTVYDTPPTIINDDAYLQFVVQMNEYTVGYEPSAVVYLRGPGTVRDFFDQRYRVTLGHYQVEQFLGGKLPTTYATRNIRIAWKVRKRVGRLKESSWFLFFLIVSGLVVAKALIDFYIRRQLPYKWKAISSTKNLA